MTNEWIIGFQSALLIISCLSILRGIKTKRSITGAVIFVMIQVIALIWTISISPTSVEEIKWIVH